MTATASTIATIPKNVILRDQLNQKKSRIDTKT